jgi:hypothetical protein
MRKAILPLVGFVGLGLSMAVLAQEDVFVYPADGQTSEQQATDENECRQWATQQTGYNPYYNYVEQEAGKGKVSKNTAIGAAGGAAGGAAIGQVIGGKPGLGALAGSALGALLGNRRGKESKEEAQNSAAAYREDYNRALTACLEARGYSVS